MKTTIGMALLVLVVCGVAQADVLPVEIPPCTGKSVGDACVLNGVTGKCENRTCSRLDYSNWNRDASSSPPSMTYACLWCQVGGTVVSDAGTDSTEDKNSGCSLGGMNAVRRIAPWMMAGSFSLLFLIFRRRRQR